MNITPPPPPPPPPGAGQPPITITNLTPSLFRLISENSSNPSALESIKNSLDQAISQTKNKQKTLDEKGGKAQDEVKSETKWKPKQVSGSGNAPFMEELQKKLNENNSYQEPSVQNIGEKATEGGVRDTENTLTRGKKEKPTLPPKPTRLKKKNSVSSASPTKPDMTPNQLNEREGRTGRTRF